MKNIKLSHEKNIIKLEIDHKNPEWFDEYGNLFLEDVEEFLQDNDFVEDEFGVFRDTDTGIQYTLNDVDITCLKRNGFCRMYSIGRGIKNVNLVN